MKCYVCLWISNDDPADMVTFVGGTAVCVAHLKAVKSGDVLTVEFRMEHQQDMADELPFWK